MPDAEKDALTEAERRALIEALVAAQASATGVTNPAFTAPGSDFERAAVRYVDQHGLGAAVARLISEARVTSPAGGRVS